MKDPECENCQVVTPGIFLLRNACHCAVSSPQRRGKVLIALAVCSDASNPCQVLQAVTGGELAASPGLTGHIFPSSVE